MRSEFKPNSYEQLMHEASEPRRQSEAINIYSGLIEKHPDRPEAYIMRGRERINKNDKAGGQSDLLKGIELVSNMLLADPLNAGLYASRAWAFSELRQYETAIADIDVAVSLDSKSEAYKVLSKAIRREKEIFQ